jgi:hypothetical protein
MSHNTGFNPYLASFGHIWSCLVILANIRISGCIIGVHHWCAHVIHHPPILTTPESPFCPHLTPIEAVVGDLPHIWPVFGLCVHMASQGDIWGAHMTSLGASLVRTCHPKHVIPATQADTPESPFCPHLTPYEAVVGDLAHIWPYLAISAQIRPFRLNHDIWGAPPYLARITKKGEIWDIPGITPFGTYHLYRGSCGDLAHI